MEHEEFQCESYLSTADIESVCGTSGIALSNKGMRKEGKWAPCDRGNRSQSGAGVRKQGQFRVLVEKLTEPSKRWTETIKVETKSKGKRTSHEIGLIKGSYSLFMFSSSVRDHAPPCNEENLKKLFEKFAAKVPTVGEAPKAKPVNPLCVKAITPAHLKSVCGKEFTLKPTFAEGLKGNPCNRSGSGLNFIVSGHGNAATAGRAEAVAASDGEETSRGFTKAQKSGNYLIEIKARKGTPCASASKVGKLAAIATKTLN